MLITELKSFNTSSSDSRSALVNLLLVLNGGWGYERVSRDVKSALDNYRNTLEVDSDNESNAYGNYKDISEYNKRLEDIMRASIKGYITEAAKLRADKYNRQVVGVLAWLAHSNYWYLLGDDSRDDLGNYVELFYPKEYDSLAAELYNLVNNKDRAELLKLLAESDKLGYNNLSNAIREIDTEIFYLSSLRNSRDQWKVIVNRFPSILEDCNNYGNAPFKLYQKYYNNILGESISDYWEIATVCQKYDKDINPNIISKLVNNSILPFMSRVAQTDEDIKALKSLLTYEN